MHGGGIKGNLGQRLDARFQSHSPLLKGGPLERHDLLDQFTERPGHRIEVACAGPRQHVEGQIVDPIEVASKDRPALPGEVQIAPLDRQFNRAGATLQPLQNILDRMADDRDGFAHGREPVTLCDPLRFTEHLKEPDAKLGDTSLPRFGCVIEPQRTVRRRFQLPQRHDERVAAAVIPIRMSPKTGREGCMQILQPPIIARRVA